MAEPGRSSAQINPQNNQAADGGLVKGHRGQAPAQAGLRYCQGDLRSIPMDKGEWKTRNSATDYPHASVQGERAAIFCNAQAMNQGSASLVRVRFGESVGEAMAGLGYKKADNDHAARDRVMVQMRGR